MRNQYYEVFDYYVRRCDNLPDMIHTEKIDNILLNSSWRKRLTIEYVEKSPGGIKESDFNTVMELHRFLNILSEQNVEPVTRNQITVYCTVAAPA